MAKKNSLDLTAFWLGLAFISAFFLTFVWFGILQLSNSCHVGDIGFTPIWVSFIVMVIAAWLLILVLFIKAEFID